MVFLSSVKKLGNVDENENHLDCCHLCSDRRIGLKCSNEKKKSATVISNIHLCVTLKWPNRGP